MLIMEAVFLKRRSTSNDPHYRWYIPESSDMTLVLYYGLRRAGVGGNKGTAKCILDLW